MERIIAYCGLVCSECPGYIATQANDRAALERLAERAKHDFGAQDATADSVRCDGCHATTGLQIGYCSECAIRACGQARGVANCAHCGDYPCAKLTGFLQMVPQAQVVLESVHQSL